MTDQEKEALHKLVAKHKASQAMALRARIILQFYGGAPLNAIAAALGVVYKTVLKWTGRWEGHSGMAVGKRLEGRPRSGCPDKFSPEQACKTIAACCENPAAYGRPITCWTQRGWVDEVTKQKIAEPISASEVGRILKENGPQPHRSRYWLDVKPDERRDGRINRICGVHANAAVTPDGLAISYDGMAGAQALERIAAGLPLASGKPQAIEFEYKRHGTQALIAGLDVSTGKVTGPCGETRTEDDLKDFINGVVAENPGCKTYHFVGDQLNTHKSGSLAQFVKN